MSDVPTISFDEYTRPFRDRISPKAAPRFRYDQCDDTCTTDCGHCKGQGRPSPLAALTDEPGHIVALTGPGSVTDPTGYPAGVLPGINDDDAPVGEVPALVAVPGGWVAPPSSQAGLASFRYARRAEPSLPYPDDEVTNALVDLDLAEEAEHVATLARTADRLAAAYAAHVGLLRTSHTLPQRRLAEWRVEERAAAFELRAALTEYEEARA